MALIGTLRNKMGTWVVVFVFVAIACFILNDLLGNNSVLFNNNNVGEIAGTTISLEEYQAAIQEREANYILNFGRKPGDREMTTLRQQAWEMLILRHAIQKQYTKVGVAVTLDEVEDMIWGKNVDENIKSTPLFTNPQTGAFEKARVVRYLNEFNSPPPADPQSQAMWQEQRTRWEIFQRDLGPGRERIKYENLILKSNYVTTAEAEREYHNQTDVAEVKYLYVPYYAVSDSVAEVTDADLKSYYDKNKEKYKTDATRDLKFVSFPVTASSADTLAIVDEMKRIATELTQTQDDSAYAASNTDGQAPYTKYNGGNLPAFIKSEDLKAGNVIGPFLDGTSYKVAKVSKVTKDTVYSARASHILIKWDNETDAAKKAAKEKARNILKDIKGGASFAEKAREFGTDGTAQQGGDLGWFTTGRMVKPFEDAVFGATKTGVLNDVVETAFGYHIISITNTKNNDAYYLAVVERSITPSDATTNEAYRKAESFASDLSGTDEFTARANEQGLQVQEAKGLGAGDRRVTTLGDARQIIQWLFRDASEGKVSDVFDLQDEYVVAVMTNETSEGYRPLDLVKEEITPQVRKEVKSKAIIEKLKGATGTLEEIAQSYGSDANVYTSSDLKLSANSLPSAGFDPAAIGVAFSLENGKRSAPISGESGVLIIEMQNKTIAPAATDYTAYKQPIQQKLQNNSYNIGEAIKENADIVDKRYKFY
ncbi:peptidylprolyl isomerase [Fulvivirgaceae bacterium PWU4]|uniref:Periplasmic chaperone PpiD n=1 Tax=Chryseosolibacter histidini TaxID=2782349 RepID=A0AAP2DM91_9BACT|nr:peptidylprolyl isomerase [Chryseosolibacter histidini]MBT1698925.1 peptidylprolyl isomerase [Chryseosolibacter histidini]